MKNIGKPFTIIFIIYCFLWGQYYIMFDPTKWPMFLQLIMIVGIPVLIICGGIAGQSIARVIKGECKIEEIKDEVK